VCFFAEALLNDGSSGFLEQRELNERLVMFLHELRNWIDPLPGE
jgi:hypothetical protein